jgi:hypothetical protein
MPSRPETKLPGEIGFKIVVLDCVIERCGIFPPLFFSKAFGLTISEFALTPGTPL